MKIFKLIPLLAVLLIIASCEKEQITPEQQPYSEIHEIAASQSGHVCIFEPDQAGSAAEDRHRILGSFLPVSDNSCFNIFISGGCNNLYTQATIDAIAAYNAITGTSLEFTIVNTQSAADITVSCADLGNGDCNGGVASPGNPIGVTLHTGISTTNCFCPGSGQPINQCHIQFIAMHEIGHAVGFAHTNSSSQLIPGTPVNDFFSVFNSGSMPNALCAGLCQFTVEDINAIQILYPGGSSQEGDVCYCVCEAQENYGDGEIFLEYIEVDCCDNRDCSEIVPVWWDEYLVNRNDCWKETQ